MFKKKTLLTLVASLLVVLLISNTVYAATSYWYNNTSPNETDLWWKPKLGSVKVNKDPNGYPIVRANLSFYWSQAQKDEMMRHISYYPTFDIRDSSTGGYDGYYIWTNLPDPKYDYEDDNNDGKDDELEVLSRDQWSITANNWYSVNTSWNVLNTTVNPGNTAFASISVAPAFPGGDYNTVIGTAEYLGGTNYNQLATNSVNFNKLATSSKNAIPKDKNEVGILTSVKKETRLQDPPEKIAEFVDVYDSINTINDLETYKNKVHNTLKQDNDDRTSKYIITFKRPIDVDSFKKYTTKVDISEIYARAYNDDKIITIGTNNLENEVLEQIKSDDNFEFSGIIEIEGETKISKLKKLLSDSNIYSIEIQSENTTAHGLYWKLEKMQK